MNAKNHKFLTKTHTVLPRITSQGSYFFEVVKKGGGSYSGDGELLFRVGNFAEKFMFSIEIGISHDDENGILASGSNVFQL